MMGLARIDLTPFGGGSPCIQAYEGKGESLLALFTTHKTTPQRILIEVNIITNMPPYLGRGISLTHNDKCNAYTATQMLNYTTRISTKLRYIGRATADS